MAGRTPARTPAWQAGGPLHGRNRRGSMTVGFYAPLPPARTGVADYAAALLAELRRHGHVEIAPRRCDVALYHLGNNPLHAGIYKQALERPGVVALHDAVLHHFLLGHLDEARYVEEFVYNYGEWHRPLAGELWRGRAAAGADARYFEFPMLRRVVERARAVVVHNPEAARIAAAAHAPDRARWSRSRICSSRPRRCPPSRKWSAIASAWEWNPARSCSGCSGTCGNRSGCRRRSKRSRVCAGSNPRAALLVAGEFVSTDLERAVGPLLQAARRGPAAAPDGARILAGGGRRGRLHQPALSGRGRDFGHCHPADGSGQTHAGDGLPGVRAISRGRLPANRAAPRRSGTPCSTTCVC